MTIARRTLGAEEGLYFSSSFPVLSSGAAPLDCALGGGWALNRIINIVGDRSTGKTLLAIEAGANFARLFPAGEIDYIEAEAAFDRPYAERVGFPTTANLIEDINTVEGLFKHLDALPEKDRLVVVDSLDAVGTDKERKEALGDHGYGTDKPKQLSEAFRRMIADLKRKHVTLIFISQVRENISGFGPKYTRSGGKALDFYASQIVWLKENGKLEKEIEKIKRALGIQITAKITKNKIGPAFREAPLEILFNYGIDNVHSCLYWLQDAAPACLTTLGVKRVMHNYDRLNDRAFAQQVDITFREQWRLIEQKFEIGAKKYDS